MHDKQKKKAGGKKPFCSYCDKIAQKEKDNIPMSEKDKEHFTCKMCGKAMKSLNKQKWVRHLQKCCIFKPFYDKLRFVLLIVLFMWHKSINNTKKLQN